MKLKEAFAKRTYGGKGVPHELSRAEQKRINTNFINALEEQMMASLYALWDDMRRAPDMMDDELQEDFPAYMKLLLDNEGYVEVIETWLDYRETNVEKKIVQMAEDRFK